MKRLMSAVLAGLLCWTTSWAAAVEKVPPPCPAQDLLIKSQVETAISMLQAIEAKRQQGQMTAEQARKLGADLLRELKYGGDGYFWADTEAGVNVVLYGRQDTEGRNRLEDQDAAGFCYVKALIAQAQAGGGYVDYLFTKKGQAEPLAKRSYVQRFAPFGWVVGTGYYRTDAVPAAAVPLPLAAASMDAGLSALLGTLGDISSQAAAEIARVGTADEVKIRQRLRQNHQEGAPYVIDSTFIDAKGVMKMIEPEKYRGYEGSDISQQEAVIKMLATPKSRMGNLFVSVEGIKSIDIESPIFANDRQFLGAVSMLLRPDEIIGSATRPLEKGLGVNCWVMQKDGMILYETDRQQVGLKLFADPLYQGYPELIALGRRMVQEDSGEGSYAFTLPGTKTVVKKQAAWRTIHFFDNDWIIVAYREVK